MYGIFTYIYPKIHPNVGIYTIHGAYGLGTTFYIVLSGRPKKLYTPLHAYLDQELNLHKIAIGL